MDDRVHRSKVVLGHIDIKSLVAAIAVIIATTAISASIGNRFYATEKEVLQQQGELNAKESAMEYDRQLLTHVNIVTLAGYAVDNMLTSRTGNMAIERYLTQQTSYIIDTLDPSTTGLYGWIGEEYLDGAGWVPDEDYVPTERPWYTETLTSAREITFITPYLDAQTNTVMMSVTDMLSDGKSVLAMDVSLEPIQQIIEEVASATEGSQAFILNENGYVVAHSDKSQLGKNYLEETDGLGSAVAHKILADGQSQFEIKADEGDFSVYVDGLEGGWYSVSLINADVWYRPLLRTIVVFTAILVVVEGFIAFFFLYMNAKNRALKQLHTRIDQEEKRGEELQILSETDRMTGLYDRVNGEKKVDELLARGTTGMLLELDIDNFKSINDTYGHQTGDIVIIAVADVLRKTFRSDDITIRLGGDEFCAFAVGIVEQGMAEAIVRRLFSRLEGLEIPELEGNKVNVSIGAVLYDGKGSPVFADLYAAVDSAMYASKKVPGNSLTFGSL